MVMTLLTCGNDLLTCENDFLFCGNNLLTCGNDLVSCGNDSLTCGNDFLSCGNDLLSCGNKIKICNKNSSMSLPGLCRMYCFFFFCVCKGSQSTKLCHLRFNLQISLHFKFMYQYFTFFKQNVISLILM